MFHRNILGIWRILIGKLLLGWKPNKVAGELDVLRLCLIHLNGGNVLNGSLDVEPLDDLDELTGLELGIAEDVLNIQEQQVAGGCLDEVTFHHLLVYVI